jgi:hypothetical protein
MRTRLQRLLSLLFLWVAGATAAAKPHVISFGKWTAAKWHVGPVVNKPVELKIRGLYVDTRLKEFTPGQPHG